MVLSENKVNLTEKELLLRVTVAAGISTLLKIKPVFIRETRMRNLYQKMVNLCIVVMKAIAKLINDVFIVNKYMPVKTSVRVP